MPLEEQVKLFEEKFNYFRDVLPVKLFANFKCFPPTAKIALIDMLYNLGETKFSREHWPAFFKAANQRNWETAANECHRADVEEKRNSTTQNLFIKAAEIEKQSQK